jgi:hypothetical protein
MFSQIPKSIEYRQEKYELQERFLAYNFDFAELLEFSIEDRLHCLSKTLISRLRYAVLEEGKDEIPEILNQYYSNFNYIDDWWSLFKVKVLFPYIESLGLEKTWFRTIFSPPKLKTFDGFQTTEIHKHYWTLVVAPPRSEYYFRNVIEKLK